MAHGVDSVTVVDFVVLPAVTNYPPGAGEVAQWVLTKKGECPRVYSQALTSKHHTTCCDPSTGETRQEGSLGTHWSASSSRPASQGSLSNPVPKDE